METPKHINAHIAELLGAKLFIQTLNQYEMYGIIESIEDGEDEQHFFRPEEMPFETSWDWLMPVVEKIEEVTTNVGFKIFKRLCLLQADNNTQLSSIDLKSNRKIDHVYNVVVQFIEWQKKNKA